jgi:signal transduction histidine kinase
MRSVASKMFLTFTVALVAFGLVAVFAVSRMHALGTDLRLLSEGYLPLTRIAAQLDVKDWVTTRALEMKALDPASRRAFFPVARSHFPALVKEKLAEARAVVARARGMASGADARFLFGVAARLEALDGRWGAYHQAGLALFDALERSSTGGDDPVVAERAEAAHRLEKGLSLEVKLLQAALDGQVADHLHAAERAEHRSTLLVLIYSVMAAAVGLGATLIGQRLLAPVRVLTEGVKAVAAGDLSRKVEVGSGDELGLLAREFNNMASSLARQRSELLRAERLAAIGRISAQITHEIRNPLNAIGLNAEILAEEVERLACGAGGPRPLAAVASPGRPTNGALSAVQGYAEPGSYSELRALVQAISREVDRLNGVTEEYLRFAKLPKPSFDREDLNDLVGDLAEFVRPEMKAARVELRLALAARLPPVRADESQLRAALLNLLRNSREAMPRGGVVTVATRVARDGTVEAEVRDTGAGIPKEEMSRIFDPFYSTKEKGTGLGLAFALQVAQEHGGTIRCESVPGRGATFTLSLPGAPEGCAAAAVEAGEVSGT